MLTIKTNTAEDKEKTVRRRSRGVALVTRTLALGSLLLGACAGDWEDPISEEDAVLEAKTQEVYNTSGSAPAPTWLKPEIGFFSTGVGSCTAVLIHKRYALTAAHCAPYPYLHPNASVTFYSTTGAVLATPGVTQVWLHIPVLLEADPFHWGVSMNTDIAVLQLASDVPATVPRARLATALPDLEDTVSVWGFGRYGVGPNPSVGCANGPDGNKRMVTLPFGPPSYRTCPGDSGGPTYSAEDHIISATSNSGTLGSVLRFTEEIYERMRYWGGQRWLSGTRRAGLLISQTPGVTSDAACETLCMDNATCKAWERNHANNNCNLRSTIGPWYGIDSYSSGIRPMVEANRSRNGAILQYQAGVISPNQCASLCGISGQCKAYVYDPSASANTRCRLLSALGTPSSASGVSSGIKLPSDQGWQRVHGDYESVAAASDAACATACAKDWECISYEFTGGTCFKKNAYGDGNPNAGRTSNMKRAMAMPGFELEGVPVAGWNLTPVEFAESCRSACENASNCNGYTVYDAQVGAPIRCTLFSSVTLEKLGYGPSYPLTTSGYKGLTYF